MDKESIVTIREELSDDFFSLAESHFGVLRRLVERLEDDQERRRQEVGERATTITISDEEQ